MNTITREQKRERFLDYMNFFEYKGREFDDDIDAAILADYAPLSPERRAELYDRRTFLSYRVNDVEETMDAPLTRPEHKAGLSMELDMLKTWLAELDAELDATK